MAVYIQEEWARSGRVNVQAMTSVDNGRTTYIHAYDLYDQGYVTKKSLPFGIVDGQDVRLCTTRESGAR